MKTSVHVFFAILISLNLYSQPILTSDKMLPYGSVMNMQSITNLDIIDISGGENITWDLSGVKDDVTSNLYKVTITNPSLTIYGVSFPNANYCYFEDNSISTAYRYFSLISDKMERLGSVSNNSVKTYSDPQVEYIFPLIYQKSNDDAWTSMTNTSSNSTSGVYNLSCIGYGTLKLPNNKTYTDALLVKVYLKNLFIEFNTYFWYDANNGAILFQYIQGDNFFVASTASYMSSLTQSTDGINDDIFNQEISYNNPVTKNLNIKFVEHALSSGKYSIMNLVGETVLTGNLNSANAIEEIDCENLTNGIYFITLNDKNNSFKTKSMKFIKI